jgi:hypothetical protein
MASPAENTPKTQSSTLGENAASYGKFRNKLSAILLGIVGFLFLVSSLYFLFSEEPLPSEATATITASRKGTSCSQENNKQKCSAYSIVSVVFKASNGQDVTASDIKASRVVHQGELVSVSYDPSNPNNFKLEYMSYRKIGFGLLGLAIFFAGTASLIWYMTRYTFMNQMTAASDAFSVLGLR